MRTTLSELSPKSLSRSLQPVSRQLDGLARLKVRYRPLICPLHRILSEIPPGSQCLDIGCGSGTLLWLIGEYCQPVGLAGVEIDQHLVEQAQSLLPGHQENIETYDGVNLPDSVSLCDIVILNDVFHHIPVTQQAPFLGMLRQRMKSGAMLIFKDIDAGRRALVYVNKLHDLVFARESGNEISMTQAQSLLEQSGFRILSKEYLRMLWYPHYSFVAKA